MPLRLSFRILAILALTVTAVFADTPETQGKLGESFFLKSLRDVLNIDAVRREFLYAKTETEDVKLDIYYPRTPAPPNGYPLIVWFHGGGWILGSKRQDVFVRHFPSYGYAIASVEYRLAQEKPFPAQVRDARTAILWLWKNARQLDLDPNALVLAGQSAGSHLALLVAFTEGQSLPGWGAPVPRGVVKAVAALYPPTDLLRLVPPSARDNPIHPVAILLGDKVEKRISLAEQASPIDHVHPGIPPVLLFHGTEDSIVPVEQSALLAKKLKANGVPTTLLLTKKGHAFTLYPDRIPDILQFFDTIPALKGKATKTPPPSKKDDTVRAQ